MNCGLIAVIGAMTTAICGDWGNSGIAQGQQAKFDVTAPKETVRLIFIHHSCGEQLLNSGHGGLGNALAANNYYVSDTNYGWAGGGDKEIGNNTDIGHWWRWFRGPKSEAILKDLYGADVHNADYRNVAKRPEGENTIVMFKSCYPNSEIKGNPDDKANGDLNSPHNFDCGSEQHTVANCKRIYNDLLIYFGKHPEKLFVVVTAPPVQDAQNAKNARAFNKWLVESWLKENKYALNNVFVFDYYAILTAPENHHCVKDGVVLHVDANGNGTARYVKNGDDHPTPEGTKKAVKEFVPLLNGYYNLWKSSRR